ncbi:FliA/WhiG family RNA polymerase sigma factor [Proteinivorax tanatarense]|uniref:RNA polymerase sigma factor n=1 Tax=Proteinivorax tanatarense TaxID=1260629 RepID=A0AAU7VPZ7_9FIRM
MDNNQLWINFNKGSSEAKEELIKAYSHIVKFVVDRIWTGYKIGSYDKEDLISLGIVGLLEAMDKYNPKLGVKFETYATPRVKGQIIDAIRKEQWLPKDILKGINELEMACEQLATSKEAPTEEKLASALGVSVDKVKKLIRYAGQKVVLRLDAPIATEEGTLTIKDTIEDEKQLSPHQAFLLDQQHKTLAELLNKLSNREKLVLNLYYNEELTLKEISKLLELSEARISQIHTKAVLRLRRLYSKAQKSF